MTSKVPQKFIEVNLAGAKELKLVVTDGGNGNGSDHATWGDAKLHFANADRLYTGELVTKLEDAQAIDVEGYTEESVDGLQQVITNAKQIMNDENVTQAQVDEVLLALEVAMKGLIEINLNEVISIQDSALQNAIKSTLGLSGDITLGNMYKLTNLTSESQGVSSLEGLQYAKNLETLNITGNSITDFSPLKALSEFTTLNADPQFVEMGELKGSVVEVENKVIGLDGLKVKPNSVGFSNTLNQNTREVDMDAFGNHPDMLTIDLTKEEKGLYWLGISYKVGENNVILRYLINHQ